jgi:hypothetical protein
VKKAKAVFSLHLEGKTKINSQRANNIKQKYFFSEKEA